MIRTRVEKMNKKILLGMLSVAFVAIIGVAVLSNTRTSATISMTARTGNVVSLATYEDCTATRLATNHDFGPVTQGNHYEWSIFVKNIGTDLLYIVYLPTDIVQGGGQTHLIVTCTVMKYGLPCQLETPPPTNHTVPETLPEKNVNTPTLGFPLEPTKMIKIDVDLYVASVVSGASYNWLFLIEGATGD